MPQTDARQPEAITTPFQGRSACRFDGRPLDPGMSEPYRRIPLDAYQRLQPDVIIDRDPAFRDEMRRRRAVRDFSDEPVIDACLETAGTAPNGANMQPWHFVVVRDLGIKRHIREAAEEEERAFYEGRAAKEWLDWAPMRASPSSTVRRRSSRSSPKATKSTRGRGSRSTT